jgi:hypothetical protein
MVSVYAVFDVFCPYLSCFRSYVIIERRPDPSTDLGIGMYAYFAFSGEIQRLELVFVGIKALGIRAVLHIILRFNALNQESPYALIFFHFLVLRSVKASVMTY